MVICKKFLSHTRDGIGIKGALYPSMPWERRCRKKGETKTFARPLDDSPREQERRIRGKICKKEEIRTHLTPTPSPPCKQSKSAKPHADARIDSDKIMVNSDVIKMIIFQKEKNMRNRCKEIDGQRDDGYLKIKEIAKVQRYMLNEWAEEHAPKIPAGGPECEELEQRIREIKQRFKELESPYRIVEETRNFLNERASGDKDAQMNTSADRMVGEMKVDAGPEWFVLELFMEEYKSKLEEHRNRLIEVQKRAKAERDAWFLAERKKIFLYAVHKMRETRRWAKAEKERIRTEEEDLAKRRGAEMRVSRVPQPNGRNIDLVWLFDSSSSVPRGGTGGTDHAIRKNILHTFGTAASMASSSYLAIAALPSRIGAALRSLQYI